MEGLKLCYYLIKESELLRIIAVLIIYIMGTLFIRFRWRHIGNIRNQIMIDSAAHYMALPPANKMFWQLHRWSCAAFTKGNK